MVANRWYVGRGRNGNVGLWDGENFLTIGEEGGEMVVKGEHYYEAESGCFQPFLLVDEGKMIEPFGKSGWEARYGETLELNEPKASPSSGRSGLEKLDGAG